jgi:cytidyltransferase-like protein
LNRPLIVPETAAGALPPHRATLSCACGIPWGAADRYDAVPMSADFESKICPPEQLAARAAALPRPLVFTNGVFDILHRGHVTYLAQARALGASLLLALNSDASVRRLGKGDDRPPAEDRM